MITSKKFNFCDIQIFTREKKKEKEKKNKRIIGAEARNPKRSFMLKLTIHDKPFFFFFFYILI